MLRSEDEEVHVPRHLLSTHHPQFGYDANDTLWTSGGGPVVGWLNTKMFDQTGDDREVAGMDGIRPRHQRQRQARRVRRARSAGRSDQGQARGHRLLRRHAEPGRRLDLGLYRRQSGAVVRVVPGSNPPETALTEVYNVPMPGFGARGGDIDRNGVVWVSLGSGHLAASIGASAKDR